MIHNRPFSGPPIKVFIKLFDMNRKIALCSPLFWLDPRYIRCYLILTAKDTLVCLKWGLAYVKNFGKSPDFLEKACLANTQKSPYLSKKISRHFKQSSVFGDRPGSRPSVLLNRSIGGIKDPQILVFFIYSGQSYWSTEILDSIPLFRQIFFSFFVVS